MRAADVPPLFAGLIAHVSAYEQLALDAARLGGRDRVFAALLAHPLVGQVDDADALTDKLLAHNADWLPWRPGDAARRGACSRSTAATARPTWCCWTRAARSSPGPGPARSSRTWSGRGPPSSRSHRPSARCSQPPARTGATHVAAYLANADLPVETRAIHDAVAAHGWAASVTVENDTFAVLRAGTGRGFGVAVVCGARHQLRRGRPDGTRLRFPALGSDHR